MKKVMVYLGADHAGFALKEKIKKSLISYGIKYEDLGGRGIKGDDYPDFAFKVARKVSKERNNEIDARGILICGTGTGMVMAANKIKGIRAAVGYDKYSVVMGRHDNDANVLCLRGKKFSSRKNLKFVKLFLNEEFSDEERHKRRLRMINNN
ncbi:MAG: RpiB/LacA/LacB family sugar-phosphate isomerase [Nanoarchaeota archaeon]|nr:RpiB/LacA/LacB family sugar-phosphate isomerase [Nanoarchaeota archaeon]